MIGDHARHVRIALQSPDIVDNRRAGLERPGRQLRFHRIDRNWNAQGNDCRQHHGQPVALLIDRNWNSSAIGPGRFRPDIDYVCTLIDQPPRLHKCRCWLQEAAAVGE